MNWQRIFKRSVVLPCDICGNYFSGLLWVWIPKTLARGECADCESRRIYVLTGGMFGEWKEKPINQNKRREI